MVDQVAEPQPVPSVARAAAQLMAFVDESDGLRLEELARRADARVFAADVGAAARAINC